MSSRQPQPAQNQTQGMENPYLELSYSIFGEGHLSDHYSISDLKNHMISMGLVLDTLVEQYRQFGVVMGSLLAENQNLKDENSELRERVVGFEGVSRGAEFGNRSRFQSFRAFGQGPKSGRMNIEDAGTNTNRNPEGGGRNYFNRGGGNQKKELLNQRRNGSRAFFQPNSFGVNDQESGRNQGEERPKAGSSMNQGNHRGGFGKNKRKNYTFEDLRKKQRDQNTISKAEEINHTCDSEFFTDLIADSKRTKPPETTNQGLLSFKERLSSNSMNEGGQAAVTDSGFFNNTSKPQNDRAKFNFGKKVKNRTGKSNGFFGGGSDCLGRNKSEDFDDDPLFYS